MERGFGYSFSVSYGRKEKGEGGRERRRGEEPQACHSTTQASHVHEIHMVKLRPGCDGDGGVSEASDAVRKWY